MIGESLIMSKCRSCGYDRLGIREYGVGLRCPKCGKMTAEKNVKEAHVYFGRLLYSVYGIRQKSQKGVFESGIDYLTLYPEYELTVGDISAPPFSNFSVYTQMYSSAITYKKAMDEYLAEIKELSDDVPVYLWLYKDSLNSYLNLCYLASEFKRFRNLYLVTYSSGECDANDDRRFDIFMEKKKRLTEDDISVFSSVLKDEELVSADYRCGDASGVSILPKDQLENCIQKNTPRRYQSFSEISGRVMDSFEEETGMQISYEAVKVCFKELILKRQIKGRDMYALWVDEGNTDMITQDHRMCDSNKPLAKIKPIRAVCEAYKWGCTIPLYYLLSEDAVLTVEAENKTVSGRGNIIDYIEADGVFRHHCDNQNVDVFVCGKDGDLRKNDGSGAMVIWVDRNGEEDVRYVIIETDGGAITSLLERKVVSVEYLD